MKRFVEILNSLNGSQSIAEKLNKEYCIILWAKGGEFLDENGLVRGTTIDGEFYTEYPSVCLKENLSSVPTNYNTYSCDFNDKAVNNLIEAFDSYYIMYWSGDEWFKLSRED